MTNKMTLKKLFELKESGKAEILQTETTPQLPYGNLGTSRLWKTKTSYYFEDASNEITRIYPETDDVLKEDIVYLLGKALGY